ncbi:uncharacterized protein LOC111717141 [Eurytemora carolleeae]|uniref:uncharacterized protein LOC111717141 n=1 Tax=Eurytemora carolleeae TaxID=1294199 RepID=UPI000C7744E5|nr:uncharacterized protein LOC111717141 [Eurytemora carolleeae]XP_023348426.1 uncharacterized protein LOC111717141 [Eurytemora carolleeae]|eukprot:XP_023348417.1 uncharacterized protein LOC111717141 [Eurytemora affinis]
MTFSMTEMDQSHRIKMEEEEEEDTPVLSIKEQEEEKKKAKKRQSRNDDIALVVCMVILVLLTVLTVIFKIMFIDPAPDPNQVTFKPLKQNVNSVEMYAGMGYLPCNGYVPCQPDHLSKKDLEERMKDALPCHDYNGMGDGPEGCW